MDERSITLVEEGYPSNILTIWIHKPVSKIAAAPKVDWEGQRQVSIRTSASASSWRAYLPFGASMLDSIRTVPPM